MLLRCPDLEYLLQRFGNYVANWNNYLIKFKLDRKGQAFKKIVNLAIRELCKTFFIDPEQPPSAKIVSDHQHPDQCEKYRDK